MRRLLVGLLIVAGFLTAIGEVAYLMWYLGPVAFPVSAVAAAVINVLLVRAAQPVTSRPGLPLAAWGIGFAGCLFTGPGGDILLPVAWQTPLLLVAGVVPAGIALARWRRSPIVS
ncbi:hypothetical protein [Skermania piniformis]|uniref:Integral membrane protein n=1 Tax=Skermania pinensis TaxID=39122 RepID=A0ABX8S6S8_9ACTN|nr:hypothetical protein [Skermania piniformis]QXQ13166.1 hypothetical protein KV203_14935 [Skermania piniformis]